MPYCDWLMGGVLSGSGIVPEEVVQSAQPSTSPPAPKKRAGLAYQGQAREPQHDRGRSPRATENDDGERDRGHYPPRRRLGLHS
jgi:hypothetical protein